MKNKKVFIIAACIIVVAAVGVILSPMVDWPVDSDKSSGDIGKAERFSREETEPISNMQELLQNDSAYKDGIVVSYVVMQTRAQQFDALVEMTNEAAGSVKEFADVLAQLNANREMIGNVCEQLKTAGDNLEAVLAGKDCPEVEQNTINAALAYTTLQKQNQLAKKFIEVADSYLKENDGTDQLKLVRDSWVDYQQMTAALDGDEKAADELEKKGYLLTPEQSVAAMAGDNIGFRLRMVNSAALASELGIRNQLAGCLNSEALAIRNSEALAIRNSEALAVRNFDVLASQSHVMNSFDHILGGLRATASALNAQESLAMRFILRSSISDAISATAMGYRLRDASMLGAR